MATLSTINGNRIVQVKVFGKRRTIRLGKIGIGDARAIKSHIEQLANAAILKLPVPMETARWVSAAGDEIHSRLTAAKLVQPREAKLPTELGPYFDGYIKSRTDLKPRTIANLLQSRTSAVSFFGAKRDMASITPGEVKDWHRAELSKRARATVSMYVKKIRQIYADAVERKLIADNPFRAVKAGGMSNTNRQVYVTTADIGKVIEACPDIEWKLVFALGRYAGLRVPSETRAMLWADILWDEHKMRVRSSKTEHHEGGASRIIPIFPEVYPLLADALSKAEPGATYVFARLRGDNLSTTGDKIIERAGLTPWVKTFQNLRSSCETDLATWLPLHVACAWIGNTETVARKHYLQVTEQHFDLATGRAAPGAAVSAGKDRTDTGHQFEKPHISRAFEETTTPKGSRNNASSLEIMQSAHRALQNALHRLRADTPKLRKKWINDLTGAVRAASPAGGNQ